MNKHDTYQNASPVEAVAVPLPPSVGMYDNHSTGPPAPPARAPSMRSFNEAGARTYLSSNKWPTGLQDAFINNLAKIPIRFFICDDSGSMAANDGHKIVETGNTVKMLDCSRWSELTTTLKFHATIAREAAAPTEFRMLNGASPIMVGTPDDADGSKYASLMAILDGSPGGGTPLCRHIREVITIIESMAPTLRANGQKACVIIATDGESSDGDIAQAMRPLKDLPCWVVIRLCTDEDKIVDYWNEIDQHLEVEMDVLDDLFGEAEEVYSANKWLNYCEPMHRLREFGIPIKEIDLLDSNLLSFEQLRKVCTIIFGNAEDFPHPGLDWRGFCRAVERANGQAAQVWSPHFRAHKDWVDVKRMCGAYGKGGCVVS